MSASGGEWAVDVENGVTGGGCKSWLLFGAAAAVRSRQAGTIIIGGAGDGWAAAAGSGKLGVAVLQLEVRLEEDGVKQLITGIGPGHTAQLE